ncbi:hypothetical protein K2173_011137 [Erythroxylum novogranatense]|uniref:Uncharacterized protein n=1 Tax=Erythroxylum novogranatense TaxID=1862640 RepID=A0AAV8U9C9_9ROSI|nr:hypothetical protein K2173_011137 [Erythroxylum novogranatense]
MGVSSIPLSSTNTVQGKVEEAGNQSYRDQYSLWDKMLEAQAKKRSQVKKQRFIRRYGGTLRARRMSMKRRARLECGRRDGNGIERRVRTLKKLIPHGDQSIGLDGLFRETTDYILSLQMKVRLMQIMVKALTGSVED